jgi:hypothetical protein
MKNVSRLRIGSEGLAVFRLRPALAGRSRTGRFSVFSFGSPTWVGFALLRDLDPAIANVMQG